MWNKILEFLDSCVMMFGGRTKKKKYDQGGLVLRDRSKDMLIAKANNAHPCGSDFIVNFSGKNIMTKVCGHTSDNGHVFIVSQMAGRMYHTRFVD
jgi:hypothetical protein